MYKNFYRLGFIETQGEVLLLTKLSPTQFPIVNLISRRACNNYLSPKDLSTSSNNY